MNKYKNSSIAKIVFSDNKEYILGTIQPLKDALSCAKRNTRNVNDVMGCVMNWNGAKIVLIEKFSCDNKEALQDRVNYWRKTKKNEKYSRGKIYELKWEGCDETYIGHTIVSLNKRFTEHRRKPNKKNKEMADKYGWDKCSIHLIEEFPCESLNELRRREQYWIEERKTKLNMNSAWVEPPRPAYCEVCDIEGCGAYWLDYHENTEEHKWNHYEMDWNLIQDIQKWREEKFNARYETDLYKRSDWTPEDWKRWVLKDVDTSLLKFDETKMIMIKDYKGNDCYRDYTTYANWVKWYCPTCKDYFIAEGERHTH